MGLRLVFDVIFISLIYVSCETMDGKIINEELLGYQKCETDFDCGTGRFCDESKACSIECSTSKDCNTRYSETGKNYECSPCGRCIPEGDKDRNCVETSDRICKTDIECINFFNSNNSCHKNFCTLNCTNDSSCKRLGMGYECNKSEGICFRKCNSSNDCYIHGWQYECQLSEPKMINQNPVSQGNNAGECVPQIGGIDWGKENNPAYPAH